MIDPGRCSIVGTGAVAVALARGLALAGRPIGYLYSRSADRGIEAASRTHALAGGNDRERAADAELVLVAVPDRAIGDVGTWLRELGAGPALHTSGALDGAALGLPAARAGSLHPLRAVAGADDDAALVGAHWFHEGCAATASRELIALLGGTLHALEPGTKTLYHAAAANLSNHTVALFGMTMDLLSAAGLDTATARAPFLALLEGTVANLSRLDPARALTGPVVRGDDGTVAAHVAAVGGVDVELRAAYVALARVALRLARRRPEFGDDAAARVSAALDG